MFVDRRRAIIAAPPELVWQSLSRVGGTTGYGKMLWRVRGTLIASLAASVWDPGAATPARWWSAIASISGASQVCGRRRR